ncbi:MAG: hypothetical protein ACRDLY_02470 [Thermoleophilaceae bacterium]
MQKHEDDDWGQGQAEAQHRGEDARAHSLVPRTPRPQGNGRADETAARAPIRSKKYMTSSAPSATSQATTLVMFEPMAATSEKSRICRNRSGMAVDQRSERLSAEMGYLIES